MLKKALASLKTRDEHIHDEYQYLALIRDIIECGTMVEGRKDRKSVV